MKIPRVFVLIARFTQDLRKIYARFMQVSCFGGQKRAGHYSPAKGTSRTNSPQTMRRAGSPTVCVVEMRGVEPLSESSKPGVSPSAVSVLTFPQLPAR